MREAESPPRVPLRAVLQHLWPHGDDERTFAVLDGARDPIIQGAVQRSGLPYRCLYTGALDPALARAAPYVVQLERDAPFTRDLAGRWGDAWGIFLRAPGGLAALHRHLRRFLRVQDERGRTLVFRYYDPRVLRPYLPTCTEAELDYVFGPVERFVVESGSAEAVSATGAAGVLVARRDPAGPGGLVVEQHALVRPVDFVERYLDSEGMGPARGK
jgi:hypothetical protein